MERWGGGSVWLWGDGALGRRDGEAVGLAAGGAVGRWLLLGLYIAPSRQKPAAAGLAEPSDGAGVAARVTNLTITRKSSEPNTLPFNR